MSALLNQYDIKFLKKKDVLGNFEPTAVGEGVSRMLNDYLDPNSINEGLALVDMYLSGQVHPEGDNSIQSEVFSARLNNDTASIYFDFERDSLQTLPLKDFKDILAMWRGFLI
jgi:hypothetical protein